MKKRIIIGILLLAGIGIGGYFILGGSEDTNEANTEQSDTASDAANQNTTQEDESLTEFENVFGADLKSLTSDVRVDVIGPDTVGFIEIAESGDLRLSIISDGVTSEFVQVDGSAYFRDASSDQWFAYDLGVESIAAAFTRGIEADFFEEYAADGVVENGEVSCSSGTCRSYTISDDGEDVTLLIDSATNRISEWSGVDNESGEPVKFTYRYDSDIDISVPENVQEFGL